MEKPIWMICVTHMFLELYLLIQASLIPVIIQEFHLSLLEASLVVTVPSLVQLSMNIPSGFFADRLNTNQLLFASMLIEGGSALLVSQTSTFWTLVLGVSLMRVASPLYHISGLSQISRIAKPEQIGRSIGFHNALGSLGSAIGVVSLAVFLSTSTLGWRWTYLFWAIPILIWGFIILMSPQLKTWRFEKTKNTNGNGLKRLYLIFSSGLLIFLITIGFREVGNTGSSTFMTTYFVEKRNLSVSTASLIFGLGPFVGIVGSLGGGYLGERRGAKKALSWSIICCAISLFALSLVSHLYLLIPIYLFYAFFSNLVWAPMNMIVANTTSVTERELSYSVYFFTEGLIASIAPTLAVGVIGLANDVWFVFPFSIIFMLTSLIILQFLPQHKRK